MLLSLIAGALLALGAWTATAQAEEHRQEGTWSPGGRLQTDRDEEHTATLLPDGRVLLVGGNAARSAAVWDPDTREVTLVTSPETGRRDHTATRLEDGRVLVAGGEKTSSAEIYDPEADEWTTVGSMAQKRKNHSATRLPNGRVLVAGGRISGTNTVLSSAEVYDPGTEEWTTVGSMNYARADHAVASLDDGRVLVAGGYGAPASDDTTEGSEDITALTATGLMDGRSGQDQTFEFRVESVPLLSGQEVTVNLDSAEQGAASYSADDSLYTSTKGDVTAAVDADNHAVLTFNPDSDIPAGTAVTIAGDGVVSTDDALAERHDAVFTRTDTGGSDAASFVIGITKLASAEIFDPGSDAWEAATPMNTARGNGSNRNYTASLLGDGTVLLFDGEDGGPPAEFYHSGDDTWQACNSDDADAPDCPPIPDMVGPRASVLDDGTAVIAGYPATQRYDPEAGEWWEAASAENYWLRHTQTVLANGDVLTAGGYEETTEVYSPETVPPPVVESVTPERGATEGGFEVSITGQDLADAIFVSFGEGDYRVGDVTQVSPTEVRVDAPQHPAGWASVRVATPGGFSEPDPTVQVEFFATDGEWGPTGDMAAGRQRAGTVLLDGPACDGDSPPDYCEQALVVSDDSSELYDPTDGRFHSTVRLPASFSAQRRTTLLDGPACRGDSPPEHCGKVLVLATSTAGQSALYEPQENQWKACGADAGFDCPPPIEIEESDNFDFRWYSTQLLDGPECHVAEGEAPDHCGTVLAGTGTPPGHDQPPPEMWLFDPADGTWTQTASTNEPRRHYVMTLIEGELCEGDDPPASCGEVLVTSGVDIVPGEAIRTETAELFDPADEEWRYTAEDPPTPGRKWSTGTVLDGRVLIAGGTLDFHGPSARADLFNPVDESWEAVPAMPDARRMHSAVALPDGRAMLAGGDMTTPAGSTEVTPSVLVFDPDAAAWSYTNSMLDARAAGGGRTGFPLVALPDERILAAGGVNENGDVQTSAEVYELSEGAVAGLVLDADTGDPIGGAEVTVIEDGEQVGVATTSDDGTYQVNVPFGTYTVTAEAAGYDPVSQDGVAVDVGGATRLDFALAQTPEGGGGPVPEPEDGLVAGTVTDAESGQTLEGVEVTVEGPTTALTTTGADGAYQMAGLAAGSYTVSADAAGYEAASQAVEVVEGEAATADFALQPEAAAAGATGSVAGTVTDAGSGEAVAGAEVTVADTAGSEVVTAGTDTSGAYTAEGLAPGDYTLRAEATGYEAASQSVTVAAGETAAADFALQPEVVEEPTGELGGELTSAQLVESACDPAAVPDAGFGDVAGSVHEDSVGCVAWYGLTLGLGDLDGDGQIDYGPNRPVTRDQMASFIARLAREAGVDLPADAPDAFGDDDGSVHEDNINALAAANITQGVSETQYVPRNPVSRDQMASFLARLAGEAGLGLPADPPDAFGDDDGSVHEGNINALAAANITRGVSEGVYAPRNPVSRGQMASFLGRLLGGFVESGIAPEGGAEVTLDRTSTASGGQLAGEVFAHKDVTSLTADGCGLSERDLSVAADGGFTVDIPGEQPAGDCELAFAVDTTRGGDAPVQTARYGFAVTVEAGGA